MYQEEAEEQIGVVDEPVNPPPTIQQPSWEEGDDITDPRGEWRRRRWVRLVKRRITTTHS